jgi:hypothetical protein
VRIASSEIERQTMLRTTNTCKKPAEWLVLGLFPYSSDAISQ